MNLDCNLPQSGHSALGAVRREDPDLPHVRRLDGNDDGRQDDEADFSFHF